MTKTAPLSRSFTERTEVLMPNDTNYLGRAFGGRILEWMDVAAAVACRRFAARQVVTARIEHVDFLAPIDAGDVVTVEAYVFDTGRTSLQVRATVSAEDPEAGEEWDVTTAFFTFVAVDDDETPVPVPALECPTEEQRSVRDRALEERRRHLESLLERVGTEADPGRGEDA